MTFILSGVKDLELRQLEYFLKVAECRSISRAAEKLHVSQPNVTISIQKLERELSVCLFDRSQKQLELTPEGTVFHSRIAQALGTIYDGLLEISDYTHLRKGSIKIGIPPMIGIYLFPKVFFDFQKNFPLLELSVFEEGSLFIRDMLEAGELDVGIVILANAPTSLNTVPLGTRQIVACLPKHHPLCARQAIAIEDLRDQPLILLKEKSFHRQIIFEKCAQHGFTPRLILSSNQIEAIKNLVANGAGISFLFEVIAEGDPAIEIRPLAEPIIVDIGLAWKKDKYLSKAARTFIDFISGYAAGADA